MKRNTFKWYSDNIFSQLSHLILVKVVYTVSYNNIQPGYCYCSTVIEFLTNLEN